MPFYGMVSIVVRSVLWRVISDKIRSPDMRLNRGHMRSVNVAMRSLAVSMRALAQLL